MAKVRLRLQYSEQTLASPTWKMLLIENEREKLASPTLNFLKFSLI